MFILSPKNIANLWEDLKVFAKHECNPQWLKMKNGGKESSEYLHFWYRIFSWIVFQTPINRRQTLAPNSELCKQERKKRKLKHKSNYDFHFFFIILRKQVAWGFPEASIQLGWQINVLLRPWTLDFSFKKERALLSRMISLSSPRDDEKTSFRAYVNAWLM